jgi:hypothetical protein
MVAEVDVYLTGLIGQPCCRKRVGRGKSLSIGFGKKVFHGNAKLVDEYYGEWELGSYYPAWRIVRDGKILCASQDAVDSLEELQVRLDELAIGPFIALSQTSEFDTRIELEGDFHIDFLGTISDDDKSFQIFGPSALFIGFSPLQGWCVGKSDEPSPSSGKEGQQLS